MIINERIKTLRKEANITQKSLAEAIGVTPGSLQRFEYGTVRPNIETLVALADYFNVSLDYLVGRSDNPKMN